jgi:SAM-dependent methyltransferase
MKWLGQVHGQLVHNRRVDKLCEHLSALVPDGATVLDVGCGDGMLARFIQESRPDIEIQGIDVFVREKTHVPVKEFDGKAIPFADHSFDVVMFVDVLHHTEDLTVLLKEAARVAKKCIILKDHTDEGFLSNTTLRFMDWVGNKPHGVVLPYNYWTLDKWQSTIKELKLRTEVWKKDLELYPKMADWIFGRSLHFVAKLSLQPERPA